MSEAETDNAFQSMWVIIYEVVYPWAVYVVCYMFQTVRHSVDEFMGNGVAGEEKGCI